MKNESSPAASSDPAGSYCDACGELALSARPNGRFSRTSCAACGAERDVEVWPLFVVTGASGVGKSTVVDHLRRRLPECLVYDKDWMSAGDWDQAAGNWLRVAHSNARSRRHTDPQPSGAPGQPLEGGRRPLLQPALRR